MLLCITQGIAFIRAIPHSFVLSPLRFVKPLLLEYVASGQTPVDNIGDEEDQDQEAEAGTAGGSGAAGSSFVQRSYSDSSSRARAGAHDANSLEVKERMLREYLGMI